MNELHGKVALITGADTEAGEAAAKILAQAGAAVCLGGRLADFIEPAAAEITAAGGQALAVAVDASEEAGAERLVQETLRAYGRIDLLVLISSVWGGGYIHEHRVATWDRIMAANLRAPFLVARAVLPGMRAQGSGHILTLLNESGTTTYEGDGVYGVSLHALHALTQAIKIENASLGIRVDTLCTGLVQSDQIPGVLHAGDVAAQVLKIFVREEEK